MLCHFCPGFELYFHVFSRATCEPRGHFSSGTLIRFTTLSYATSPFVRTVLRCEFTLLFGRNISGIFSFSTPPASPRFLLRSGRRDMPFFADNRFYVMCFFCRERYVFLALVRSPRSHSPSVLFCLTYRTTYSSCSFRRGTLSFASCVFNSPVARVYLGVCLVKSQGGYSFGLFN